MRARKFAARGVAVGQTGRVLCAWYCNCCEIVLDGQKVILLFGNFFFNKCPGKYAGAHLGAQGVDSLQAVVPESSSCP